MAHCPNEIDFARTLRTFQDDEATFLGIRVSDDLDGLMETPYDFGGVIFEDDGRGFEGEGYGFRVL